MSKIFALDRKDVWPILKPALYATASIAVAALISFLSVGTIDPRFAPFIPLVNAILVAIKKFLDNGPPAGNP